MHLKSDKAKGVFTLTSGSEAEENMLRALVIKGNGSKFNYVGREGADCNKPLSERMLLCFMFESQRIVITANSDESEKSIRSARDAIFFGGGGLTLVDYIETDSKLSVNVCVNFCKHCRASLIELSQCEWETCEACVAKCEHTYESGLVHGGKAGQLGMGIFCIKCGRGKPEKEPSIILDYPRPITRRLRGVE